MTTHRFPREFDGPERNGVITIGEAAALVMERLRWNRMKWARENGHTDHLRRRRKLARIEAIWNGR